VAKQSPTQRQRWDFYWHALAGDFTGWDNEGAPFPGFYRFRYSRRGLFVPCAIWDTAGRQTVGVKDRTETPERPLVLWGLFCWMHPVSEEAYRHAVQYGTWWDTLIAFDPEGRRHAVSDVRKAAPMGPSGPHTRRTKGA